jgi:hypothetical protein
MNQDQLGTRLQHYLFHGDHHREIGIRAVAAAVLYQGNNVERTISRELSAPAVSASPPGNPEP